MTGVQTCALPICSTKAAPKRAKTAPGPVQKPVLKNSLGKPKPKDKPQESALAPARWPARTRRAEHWQQTRKSAAPAMAAIAPHGQKSAHSEKPPQPQRPTAARTPSLPRGLTVQEPARPQRRPAQTRKSAAPAMVSIAPPGQKSAHIGSHKRPGSRPTLTARTPAWQDGAKARTNKTAATAMASAKAPQGGWAPITPQEAGPTGGHHPGSPLSPAP